jgi:tRNA A37 threonylcarbamoyladenosine synthetase subunit TsaC/SUA5/YrdC
VDGGTSPREVASTIVDLSQGDGQWRLIRGGAIPQEQIAEMFEQG